MKFGKILLFSVFVTVLFTGCDKISERVRTSKDVQEIPDSESEPIKVEGYVILHGLSVAVIEEGTDTKTASYHGKSLTIGEKVTIIGDPITAVYRDAEKEYSRISYSTGEEQEGYVRIPYVVANSTFAVVTSEKAIIYDSPKLTSPTNTILPRLSLVAMHNDFSDNNFVKITYADQESTYIYENRYLKKSDVSVTEDDVVSSVLFFLASRKEGVAKLELLENAQQYSGSIFLPEIERALNEIAGDTEIEEISAIGTINDNNVNIRDLPNIENSTIVATVDLGEKLVITGRTKEDSSIQGTTSRWYRTAEPKGWIFGAYLDF